MKNIYCVLIKYLSFYIEIIDMIMSFDKNIIFK